jgi:predicted fused transcriptional regulator/phosphomethylpyrimidine kinase
LDYLTVGLRELYQQPKTAKGIMNISYQNKLIKSIKEKYSTETEAYRRKEQAENLIFEYFGELIEELYDETEAVDDQFDIDYDKLKLNGIELDLDFDNSSKK